MRKPNKPAAEPYDQQLYRGQFGFRTRKNRSGADPFDTQMEIAHAQGRFLKAVFTFRLRTRNPLLLVTMVMGALWMILPLGLLIGEYLAQVDPERSIIYALFIGLPEFDILSNLMICFGMPLLNAVVGILLLVNIVLSIKDILTPPRPD